MPKGVEHKNLPVVANVKELCWISDAERRWARQWRIWLLCNNSSCWISDAERRWALLIDRVLDPILHGVESLMPKGVEHSCGKRFWRYLGIVLNLWCRKALSTISKPLLMKIFLSVESLMPKGVEHILLQTFCLNISLVLNLWCRKALSTGIPPEKQAPQRVLNLWCRKALSTKVLKVSLTADRAVLNLWCRKALSTHYFIKGFCDWLCVESLMPKGVEHRRTISL